MTCTSSMASDGSPCVCMAGCNECTIIGGVPVTGTCVQCSSGFFFFNNSCYSSCDGILGTIPDASGTNCIYAPPCSSGTYQSGPPSNGHRTCSPVKNCTTLEVQTVPPTTTSDRQCISVFLRCGNQTGIPETNWDSQSTALIY